jgi:hypothetical protein
MPGSLCSMAQWSGNCDRSTAQAGRRTRLDQATPLQMLEELDPGLSRESAYANGHCLGRLVLTTGLRVCGSGQLRAMLWQAKDARWLPQLASCPHMWHVVLARELLSAPCLSAMGADPVDARSHVSARCQHLLQLRRRQGLCFCTILRWEHADLAAA